MAARTVLVYQSADGCRPFTDWLDALKDRQARARIRTRRDRLTLGNLGDHRVQEGTDARTTPVCGIIIDDRQSNISIR